MRTTCKNCWKPIKNELIMNHYNFCGRPCRIKWINKHRIPRKKLNRIMENQLAVEKQELLGWIPNPYKGKRMFFHWQIMPMPHRSRAKSIPEFARDIRDLIDSLLNNMVISGPPSSCCDKDSGIE